MLLILCQDILNRATLTNHSYNHPTVESVEGRESPIKVCISVSSLEKVRKEERDHMMGKFRPEVTYGKHPQRQRIHQIPFKVEQCVYVSLDFVKEEMVRKKRSHKLHEREIST